MNQSTSISELAKALVAAQAELGHATKDSLNPAFRSKYADITAVIDAVRPVYQKFGLCLVQSVERSAVENHIDVSTRILHLSGEWLESTLTIPLPQGKGAQGLGMSATYGRRYGGAAMCFLGQEDDDGNEASGVKAKPQQPKPTAPVTEDKPAEAPTATQQAAPEPVKRGPGRPKKSTETSPEGLAALKASFAAAMNREDITKLIPQFTALTPAQQQEIMPEATAARVRAGL